MHNEFGIKYKSISFRFNKDGHISDTWSFLSDFTVFERSNISKIKCIYCLSIKNISSTSIVSLNDSKFQNVCNGYVGMKTLCKLGKYHIASNIQGYFHKEQLLVGFYGSYVATIEVA